MWYNHRIYVEKQMYKCLFNNVHFLHLEYNTLPENKKYILGCQCNYCKSYFLNNCKEIVKDIVKQILNYNHFKKYVPTTEFNWNSEFIHVFNGGEYLYSQSIFDPLYNINIKFII